MVRVMYFRPIEIDGYRPPVNLLRAMLLKEILGDEIDKYFLNIIMSAVPEERIKTREYIKNADIMREIGYAKS